MPLDSDSSNSNQALTDLQEENRRLRDALQAVHSQDRRGVSRRGLLAGGATVLAASAGAGVFAPLREVSAAPETRHEASRISPLGASRLPSPFYLQVVGARQGPFPGVGALKHIAGVKYENVVATPIDPATGYLSGRRRHDPVQIVKEIDSSSLLFFRALVNNETLTSVTVSFPGRTRLGLGGVEYIVTLTNAFVVSVEQMIGNVADEEETSPRTLEEISFTYQKIEWTWTDGGISASDDWLVPG